MCPQGLNMGWYCGKICSNPGEEGGEKLPERLKFGCRDLCECCKDGEGAKLKERGKESMENEYKKIEGKKKGKNRVWGDDKN